MPLKIYETTHGPFPQINHVIAIAAGKGGVGKSTVTVNLALALKLLGFSVGILDADIYGPSIRKMLPEDKMPVQKGQTIVPAQCQGIQMISMAYFRKEQEASAVRAPIANGLIMQFIKSVQWGQLDYLLLDFPPGTGDIQLTLSQQANVTGAVMVTTPQEVAVLDVKKAMNMFSHVKIPIIGIVENMSYFANPSTGERAYIFGKGGGDRLAKASGLPLLGEIPVDPSISHCGDKGLSLFSEENAKDGPSALEFLAVAKKMVSHVEVLKNESAGCLQNFELQWNSQ